jgi:hypothetical protein
MGTWVERSKWGMSSGPSVAICGYSRANQASRQKDTEAKYCQSDYSWQWSGLCDDDIEDNQERQEHPRVIPSEENFIGILL